MTEKRFEVASFPGSLLYFTSVQESLFAPTLKAKGVTEKRFEVASFEQLTLGSNCTSPCTRPRMFLLAWKQIPAQPYTLPLFPETINGLR